jgi:hypothetical protein
MVGGLGFPQVCKIWWSIYYDPPVMKALSSLQWIIVHALIICIVLCCENLHIYHISNIPFKFRQL